MNVLDCITQKVGVDEWLMFVAPFLLLAALLYFLKNSKMVIAGIYSLCALLITFTGSTGNFSGAIFLVFAIYIFNSSAVTVILLSLSAVAIAARYVFMGYTIPDTLNLFVAYAFVLGVYFILMHPKKETRIVVADIDATTIQIVKYLQDGMRVKDISENVYLSDSAIYQRLHRAREMYRCGNNVELYERFDELGYFSMISDTA